MDAEELLGWLGYDKSNDEKYRKETLEQIHDERQGKLSAKDRFQQIKNMFKIIGAGTTKKVKNGK